MHTASLRTRWRPFIYRYHHNLCNVSSICNHFDTKHPETLSSKLNRRTIKRKNDRGKSLVSFNSEISKHGKNGDLVAARAVFNGMPNRDVASWTAMLTAYAKNAEIEKARKVFDEMPERNVVSWNSMISGYVTNRRMEDAYELFQRMPEKNLISWTALISGFAQNGLLVEAENLFCRMPQEKNLVACNAMLTGYVKNGEMDGAREFFERMDRRDVVSWSSMVDGYCRVGKIVEARNLFDQMPERNVLSWTAMIGGYSRNGMWEAALSMFLSMRRLGVIINATTLTVVCDASVRDGNTRVGFQIHGLVISMGFESDAILGSTLITMYSRNGMVDYAFKVFHGMNKKDMVGWNAIIAGYVQNEGTVEAYSLFLKMPRKDVVSWTTIVQGFINIGCMKDAILLFEKMPGRDIIAWTTIISGFVQNYDFEQAFIWFIQMVREGFHPNPVTFSSLLSASTGLAALNQGEQVHAHALKRNFQSEISVSNLLISMYSKCGSIEDAYHVFRRIKRPCLISWNSMITGFAQHGHGVKALKLFEAMQHVDEEPNHITFLGLLTACTHVGLVDEGLHYFSLMRSSYGIDPGPDHYACVVDLLGRAGLLEEAFNFINEMPYEPCAAAWGALLGASKTYKNLKFAKIAVCHLLELEPQSAIPYVVLSDMHAMAGQKKDEKRLRMIKRLKDVKKKPGYSWITVNSEVHLFFSGNGSNMEFSEVHSMLRNVSLEMEVFKQNLAAIYPDLSCLLDCSGELIDCVYESSILNSKGTTTELGKRDHI